MPDGFWLGLLTIPAIVGVAAVPFIAYRLFASYVTRLKRDDNTYRRATDAARLFAGRRGITARFRHIGFAVVLGWDFDVQDRASAALMDEFAPRPPEPTVTLVPTPPAAEKESR